MIWKHQRDWQGEPMVRAVADDEPSTPVFQMRLGGSYSCWGRRFLGQRQSEMSIVRPPALSRFQILRLDSSSGASQ